MKPDLSPAAPAVVEKIGNRFVVYGVWAVMAERRVNEETTTVYRTRREATIAAERIDRINREAIEYLGEVYERRHACVVDYLAARAARVASAPVQLSLF